FLMFRAISLAIVLNIAVKVVRFTLPMESNLPQFVPQIKEHISSQINAIDIVNKDYKRFRFIPCFYYAFHNQITKSVNRTPSFRSVKCRNDILQHYHINITYGKLLKKFKYIFC